MLAPPAREVHIDFMATQAKTPGDLLPSKFVLAQDGALIEKKVVQANSPTFAKDLEAAFQWNVRRILSERREREDARRKPS